MASKSLIEADLLLNLPPTEQVCGAMVYMLQLIHIRLQYSKSSSSGRIPVVGDMLQPGHTLHRKFAWSLGTDKESVSGPLIAQSLAHVYL